MSLNSTTGQITGTPLVESPSTAYRVTGVNSAGSAFADVTISVQSGTLLDLGHDAEITRIVYTGLRVLSVDQRRRARLFDAQTGATLVRAEPACTETCGDIAKMAGNVLVIRRPEGFHVYDATTGARTATIDRPTTAYTGYWDLATDGSYIVDRRIDGMAAWTSGGRPLFARNTGNYAGALTVAEANEYRIANGPLGGQVVEYITVSSGAVRQSATLIGNFRAWFADGQRFLTTSGAVAVVYSSQAVQQWTLNLADLQGLAGFGDWVWTKDVLGRATFYAVGGPGTPAVAFDVGNELVPNGNRLVSNTGQIIDFGGATPTSTQLDTSSTPWPRAFGVQSLSDWVVGDRYGVVIARPTAPQPLRLSRGVAYGIVGSDMRFAIALASGELLYYDTATRTLEGSIDFPAYKLALSRDGTTLAASGGQYGEPLAPRSLRLYSLPMETLVMQWPIGNSPIEDFALSDDGNRIGQQLGNQRLVLRRDGSVVLTESGAGGPVRLSPSGNRIAIPAQSRQDVIYSRNATSNVYTNGVLSASVAGWVVGWIDESRMLVHRYVRYRPTDPYGVYGGAFVVDANGVEMATTTLPAFYEFQRIDGNDLYIADLSSVFEISTGAELWHSALGVWPVTPNPVGAVAGDYVIYAAGAAIRAEPR